MGCAIRSLMEGWLTFFVSYISTVLFTDHFMQGLSKHMKGTGEPAWTYEGHDDAFGDGSNLPNPRILRAREGRSDLNLRPQIDWLIIGSRSKR